MKTRSKFVLTLVLAALAAILSACGSAQPAPAMTEAMGEMMTTEAMTESPAMPMTEDAMATEDAMMEETAAPEAMIESPAWFGTSLTDVNTGNAFTINDFKGKVVLVEMMAQWCSVCRSQQDEVIKLHQQMAASPDLVTIALDIDPNEDAETLKTYTATRGYDWLYVVPSTDTAREIGTLYGKQFLNPPSAPMLVIDRKGEVHALPFGVKSADALLKALEPFLSAAM